MPSFNCDRLFLLASPFRRLHELVLQHLAKAPVKALIHHAHVGTGVQSSFFSLILVLNSSDMSALKRNHESNEFPNFW